MTNTTQLMKSVIRNKQQIGPEERTSQAISHTSRFPFIFTCASQRRGCPVQHTVAEAPQGNQQQLLCVSDKEHT